MQKYLSVASRRRLNKLICSYRGYRWWKGFSAREFYKSEKEYTRYGVTSTLVR